MMMIHSAHVSEIIRHVQNLSTASNFSISSNENTDEKTSKQIFSVILDNIMFFSEYHSISFYSLEYSLELYACHFNVSKYLTADNIKNIQSQAMTVLLETKTKITVKNDEDLYLTCQEEYTDSNKYETISLLSLKISISSDEQEHIKFIFY